MAKAYLLSFEEIDNIIIQKHLNNWQNGKPLSMDKLLLAILHSVIDRQGVSNSIGDLENLRPFLYNFEPTQIKETYGSDWDKLFDTIQKSYTPPGRMERNNSKNYWVIFCKSTLSASQFLSRFPSIEEFDKFVSQFYLNEYTRVALPLLLEKEIFGIGFALACNFLKENGYPKFVKPDIHIKAIFNGIGLSHSEFDYEVFKDVIRFSEAIEEIPYVIDKLFWLVGSGNFYLDEIKIKTDRDEFIKMVRNEI